MPSIYFDTTVIIDLFSVNNTKVQQRRQTLTQYNQKITSTYVKMEFKRAHIQRTLVYLLNLFNQEKDLGEIKSRIDKLQGYHKQQYARCAERLAYFFSWLSNEKTGERTVAEIAHEKIPNYLRRMISWHWSRFEKEIDTITDGTSCVLAKIAPLRVGNTFDVTLKKCKSTNIQCKIVEFLRTNCSDFERVKIMLENLPSRDQEQTKMLNSLNHILIRYEHISDQRHCWDCSDAIIAIEAPNGSTVMSSNTRHFSPICNALGKTHII